MTVPHNPFEHHHPHHGDSDSFSEDIDPASQSLADALRVSFWVLKAVMVLLLIAYLFSGVFNVREQEVAVRLRFGKIVGEIGGRVLGPGGPYFALPFPIEQVIRVPTSPGQIELNRQFWYEVADADQAELISTLGGKAGPLDPERDGSLLSGDANIIHARWTATYAVVNPVDFVTRVADRQAAARLVTAAAEQGVVYAAARMSADDLIKAQHLDAARRRAQDMLDSVASGIKITSLAMKEAAFPLPVRPAVQSVLDAESDKAQLIEAAKQEWDTVLGNTAGEAYGALLSMISRYELASDENEAEAWKLQDQLDDTFDQLKIYDGDRKVAIGGEVAAMIHESNTYRTEVVAQIRGEVQYFNSLLPQYRQNPQIVLNRLWQDAKQEILTGDIETIYLPPGQAYVELNRDPGVRKERERKRLIDEEQTRQDVNR